MIQCSRHPQLGKNFLCGSQFYEYDCECENMDESGKKYARRGEKYGQFN